MNNRRNTIIKLFHYIGKYKYLLFLSIAVTVISCILQLYIPILVGNAIDNIISAGHVNFDNIIPILIEMAIIILFISVFQWIQNILNNRVTFSVVRDLRNNAFEKVQRLPLKYIDSHSNGEIVSRIISDADQIADGLLMGFSQLISGITMVIGTIIFMLSINVVLTIVVVVLTPLSFLITRFISSKTYNMFKKQSEIRGEQTAFIEEMISNQKVVDAYSHRDENEKTFSEINDRYGESSMWATFYSSLTNPTTRLINAIVYAAVALFGALFAISGSGNITVGILTSFLAYANQYSKPFNDITSVITELQNAFACTARLIDLIEEEEVNPNKNGIEINDIKGEFNFENISFSYSKDTELIKDFSFRVKPHSKIAIVGETGSGKTTLINLIMKFYDVQSGDIFVDKKNYSNISVASLRESYGMVLQDTWLKTASVADNIRLGKPDADINEVIDAAKAAYAHSFISRLPDGYDTIIGSDGIELSQGQKQLICISRLMLLDKQVLLLDESTSNIDARTEIKVQKAFMNLMRGKTVFIVAHRFSTIKDADLIIVMDNGKIVETGNHRELLDKKNFYYKLYYSQFPDTNKFNN